MDPEDAPELKHAPYSPSSLKMYALCPSWKPGDSEEAGEAAANRGTSMHKAFETGDLSYCIDDEEKLLVQKALIYVNGTINRRIHQLQRAQRAASNHNGSVGVS
jgi:hypothetical protein